MNFFYTLVAPVASAAIAIGYKIIHWKNYQTNTKSQLRLKLFFSMFDIQGATSKEKKEFMKDSNLITGAAITLLLFIVVIASWKLISLA